MTNLNSPCFLNRLKKFSNSASANDLLENVNVQNSTSKDIMKIFNKLGLLLLEPKHTTDIAFYFRKELLNILYSVIDFKQQTQSKHQRICVALAKLINIHPDVESFMISYFERYSAPFNEDEEKHPPKKKAKLVSMDVITDLDIVVASHTFLKRCPDFFKTVWTWSSFFDKYLLDKTDLIRWYCYQCLQILTGMNEHTLQKLMRDNLPEDKQIKCILDQQSEQPTRNEIVYLEDDAHLSTNTNVICISGIYLPVCPSNCDSSPTLVEVESTRRNLRKLALAVASSRAIILQGPVGSGKTFLVEYLTAKTGRVLGENFVKVQLSDQTDSKMLLGTYCCTDVPGEFVWQPGVLTQAVLDGTWLLLEDIDLANMDIASLLTALLENGHLTVPGYRDALPISAGFKLFMTQRLISTTTGFHKKQTNAIMLLEKNVLQISVDPLTPLELEVTIQTMYPKLKTVASRMVEAFLLFSPHSSNRSNRLVSTRDFFKWCVRADIDFDVTSQDSALNILQNAIDVFCCAYLNVEERLTLARDISSCLGIINQKADFYCNTYKPTLSLSTNCINSNRIVLKRQENPSDVRLNFCFTRPSSCLLERIMCCVNMKEPVLLVGETGTGKTSAVQYLAYVLGTQLTVINMNQQSDSADLLGGYKPVDLKFIIGPIRKEFERVFKDYFNVNDNREFLKNIDVCYNNQKWNILLKMMIKSCQAALQRLHRDQPLIRKKKKSFSEKNELFRKSWVNVNKKLEKLQTVLKHKMALAFSFIEGSLVKAVQNGYWVLLDEINLANAETLECLSGLLEDQEGSINLIERGDKKPITRHPNFTLFACMNPSTDVGKRDLPSGLRNRFTEFFVDELTDKNDLLLLVDSYLNTLSIPAQKLENIVKFYVYIRKEAQISLNDGLGHKPHYSLRTLCRALMIAARNPCKHFVRSLFEAFSLSFLTQLDTKSYKTVQGLIIKYILGSTKDMKSVLNQPIPKFNEACVHFEGYWVTQGTLEPDSPPNYILTDSVRHNLKDLVRVVSIGKSPVLLQGDTSVGKTSLITYLAKSSGNKCVRINNHEHTDLQEYIGSYVVDVDGKLVFREGLLVEAMRQGHWLILDELNLAPTDVLEALNRVLDDNRELFIPETHQVVKAHPNFVLFATQNPPGLYGGRKMLSRAFRNRFVELHFNEIPSAELEIILHKRCEIPMSYSKKMVAVMTDLQMRRRGSAAFAGKQGFITLRDLFRWGERYHLAEVRQSLYDWDQHLADEGYLLLAGRVRNSEERKEIAEALEKQMKRKVIPYNLFTLTDETSSVTKHILQQLYKQKDLNKQIVWTYNMRQLAVLVAKSLEFKEPVLLVGETGGGKTTACQLLADMNSQELYTINCHMHTESSDFIGGLRPVRDRTGDDLNRLFEWVDGPLIKAMYHGGMFLADEISLADDSVLERLNSLLEPERCLLLAEKSSDINNLNNSETIVAHDNFHFVATMNPGGDYGKKELSPALRNRFTEIWCESCSERDDLIAIIEQNIERGLVLYREDGRSGFGKCIMDFVDWFKATEIGKRFTISIRDMLSWASFINVCGRKVGVGDAFVHGACLTFLDSLGSGNTSMENCVGLKNFENRCMDFLAKQLQAIGVDAPKFSLNLNIQENENYFGINPFYIDSYQRAKLKNKTTFFYHAPTCTFNTLRLLRGLQLNKAILLEGSPGVGKTSIVMALAKSVGVKVLRINLSDQTDISDLFGADFPVENGVGGSFAWRDGPFLQALKNGYWILLDELNLASQSVLEGLNACLDHRGEIFIPELGKTFHVKPGTRLFACQNPVRQGGSRRGLPQSFLNRFTQVFINPLNETDLECIVSCQFPTLTAETVAKIIKFNSRVVSEMESHSFGHRGSPWEFNLRDVTRWCEAIVKNKSAPQAFVQLIYSDRMRTANDKQRMCDIFEEVFGCSTSGTAPTVYVTETKVRIGDLCLEKEAIGVNTHVLKQVRSSLVLRNQIPVLRSLGYCVKLNWMAVLVGASSSGKSSVVQTLASLLGKTLWTLPVTSAMDTTDILGGFEQVDYTRHLEEISKRVENVVLKIIQNQLFNREYNKGLDVLKTWEKCSKHLRTAKKSQTMVEETELFKNKLQELEDVLDYLKSSEASLIGTISDLESDIRALFSQVFAEDNLNAGGRFEWIDSLLIKCLQEGSWLLIDNVNLCSPAVLDRLNGLLEPNGVLKIGERGIKEDGKMFKVKPHKDFRLFLTMDPKNGEISRAMRNRGIEIYLLGENEDGFATNAIDLKSLINHNGLSDSSHVNAVLKMHNFISDLTIGEKPNTNHLLQAAFLTAQQLLRGINIKTALHNSIVDVYYKQQTASEFSSNDILPLILDKVKTVMEDSPDYYHNSMTLKSSDLSLNSCLANVKQQSVLLPNLAEDLFCNTLINTFTVSSSKNVTIRQAYLKQLPKCKIELCDKFHKICAKFDGDELPYDCRWIPDLHLLRELSNNLYLTLYFSLKTSFLSIQPKVGKSITLFDFLKGVSKKKVEGKVDDVLEKEVLNALNSFDQHLQETLKTQRVSDLTTVEIVSLLQWRFLLYELTTVNIHKMDLDEYKQLINELHIHYRWFIKHSVKEFCKTLDIKVPENIIAITNNIHDFSTLHKISKTFQKYISKPPPFNNETQILLYNEYKMLIDNFDLNAQNNYLKMITFLYEHENLRHYLIEARGKLNDSSWDFTQLNDLYKSYLADDSSVIEKGRLKLLPIIDHFACLALNNLKSNFNHVVNKDILDQTITVPSNLIGTLEYFLETKNDCLKHELKATLCWYLLNAASISPFKFTNDVDRNSMGHFTPVLSTLVTELLIPGAKLRTTTFGHYREITKQHRALNLMLWRNLLQLSYTDYDYIECETKYIVNSFEEFLAQLSNSLKVTGSSAKEQLNLCIEQIQERYRNSDLRDKHDDCNMIISLLRKCSNEIEKLLEIKNGPIYVVLNTVSNALFLLSYIKTLFTSKLPLIDPLVKTQLKKKYCQKEIEEFSCIAQSYELQNDIYSGSSNTIHCYVPLIKEKLTNLEDKNKELRKYVAVRPEQPNYNIVSKEITHYLEMVLIPRRINKLLEDLDNFCQTKNTSNFKKVMQEAEQQSFNFNSLVHILNKYRYNYSDIIGPLLNNVTEFLYAIMLKINLSKALFSEYNNKKIGVDLNEDLIRILQFPVLNKNQQDYLDAVAVYTAPRIQNFINNFVTDNSKVENFRLLKCGIQELYNVGTINVRHYKIIDKKLFAAFDQLLQIFVSSWKEQEEEREKRQKEQESLYKFAPKTEDEEIKDEFNKLFPSFHDKDFSDLEPKMLDDDEEMLSDDVSYVGVITLEDVKFVADTHLEFLRLNTESEWLRAKGQHGKVDFVVPLLSKFKLCQLLTKKFTQCLLYKIDAEIIGSLNILTNVAENFGDVKSLSDEIPTGASYDFYKDSNIEQVKGSYHILEELRLHILELQKEWPDHPSLKLINVVIERIFTFDMASPLSRFLTGFEILLAKCHEWEENAHVGVSLQEHIQNLVRQIVSWRQIEMNVWKDSLNVAFERANQPIAKWWFYIYGVVLQFIRDDEVTPSSLLNTLKKFIEQSNLGEFSNRLQLLLTFHYHVVQLERTKNTDVLAAILWNLHKHYKQYEANVVAKIKELRSPIEKKLKDYIKIVRWKDISYWAIKQTLERTHKTLHKHTREFENVIKQPVATCLVLKTSESKAVGIWDKTEKEKVFNQSTTNYIATQPKWDFNVREETTKIFKHSERYFNKSRSLCKRILVKTNYSQSIENLDEFVTDVIESCIRLQDLEVNTTLTKDKQKSQAKGILQQKRKALADLFKALTELGLSYRTGIIQFRTNNEWDRFLIKPIDLDAGFSHLNKADFMGDNILSIWKDCENYYCKAQARLDLLKISVRSPAQDLGLQNLERCKGFSENLMQMIYKHKALLINTSRAFYYLQVYSVSFSEFCEDSQSTRVPFELHQDIVNLVQKTLTILEQYKIILSTAPDENNIEGVPVLKPFDNNFIQCKNDNTWRSCMSKIASSVSNTQKILTILADATNYAPSVEFKCAKPVFINVPLQDILNSLDCISNNLKNFNEIFNDVPLTGSSQWLVLEITNLKNRLQQHSELQSETSNNARFKRNAQKLLKQILVILQNMYKKYKEDEPDENPELLKTKILNNLLNDTNSLDITAVLKHLHNTINCAHKLNSWEISKSKQTFLQIRPVLKQLILLYQYFLTQQVSAYRAICKMSSALSNIFNELATKGFCVPPEFSEELNAEGDNRVSNGMGLGDGEGELDVSDRIESEDQLDDATPAGEEKKEQEDKDCKEEEKGIEMSEDFDAKMQDIEKGDDDSNEKSDNEDNEEQMGDTDKNADQLDQQIWGSDDEIENEEGIDDEKEEKGDRGEKQGQDELGAKENDKSNETDDREGNNSEEKKKEINEMEEPEYDDDQVDPYHGNPPQYPEPEAMDLPQDLEVEDDMRENDENLNDENPFDIDTMKEQQPPNAPEPEVEAEPEPESKENESDSEGSHVDPTEADAKENEEEDIGINEDEVKMPEEKSKEDFNEEKDNQQSALDETETQEQSQAMDVDEIEAGDNVKMNKAENQKNIQINEEKCQEDKPDKEGVGQSRMEESKSGHAGQAAAQEDVSTKRSEEDDLQNNRKPGETDSKRTLGDVNESVKKKLKTIEAQQEEGVDDNQEEKELQNAEIYQHIKDAKKSDNQVLDAATEDQANEQQDLPELKDGEDEAQDTTKMHEDEDDEVKVDESIKQKAERIESDRKKSDKKQHHEGEVLEDISTMDVEGDIVDTTTVLRGDSTTYHTQYKVGDEVENPHLTFTQMNQIRVEVEQQLSGWIEPPTNVEAEQTWRKISSVTSALAQGLSEQLRLVLEPTQASRLKGDYRTGRRINMRKVIPYIASQFRKDKIWLRRTKPSKREYQIALAIDDSSSMSDNRSKELAFESVALISKALTLLESGQLSVLSFGETTEVLHKLNDSFTEKSGSNILQKFQFSQKKTCVAKLVDFVTEMLNSAQSNTTALIAKLLIIVSDGRGIFSEGEVYVQQAVRRAKLSNIFMVFLIIDNPESKDSILDIRMPLFKDGKLLGIKPYMDSFPFPFYIILRNISSLPNVLSDALRQWFEIVSNVDKQ